MSAVVLYHFPNRARSSISVKSFGKLGKALRRKAAYNLFKKQLHHLVEEFEGM